MRITEHPILDFKRGTLISFRFDGKELPAYKGETIAVALHAAGIRTLSHSLGKNRARGLYCAIGNCASCNMVVDGESNVKTCVTLVQDGMIVETQIGKGTIS